MMALMIVVYHFPTQHFGKEKEYITIALTTSWNMLL